MLLMNVKIGILTLMSKTNMTNFSDLSMKICMVQTTCPCENFKNSSRIVLAQF